MITYEEKIVSDFFHVMLLTTVDWETGDFCDIQILRVSGHYSLSYGKTARANFSFCAHRFGTTLVWINDEHIFIFGRTVPHVNSFSYQLLYGNWPRRDADQPRDAKMHMLIQTPHVLEKCVGQVREESKSPSQHPHISNLANPKNDLNVRKNNTWIINFKTKVRLIVIGCWCSGVCVFGGGRSSSGVSDGDSTLYQLKPRCGAPSQTGSSLWL